MLFSYGNGQQRINDNEKCWQIARNFDCHVDAAVRCGAHRQMEHIQGFNWSHRMLPLVECLSCIAPAAAMVDEFERNTQNTNKTQLLASNYVRCFLIASCLWEFWDPKWTLYSAHRCDKLCLNVKHHDWSRRARGHFQLSNVVRGQKVKKSSMWRATFKCETPRLEPKSSWTFPAIKRCQGTKSKKVIDVTSYV